MSNFAQKKLVHVQFEGFADDDVKQLTIFDIAYHTRMIYKPIHIENMFWIFVLKQIKCS